jgi:ATP-dependent RNA helicase DeaD
MRYSEMNLSPEILKAVEAMGFAEPTEVQEKAIPPMLEGHDLVAKAPTGTGKTCAFGIPLLMGLDPKRDVLQALILAPTRELAQQIADDLRDLARFMPWVRIACVYGGQPIRQQFGQLNKKPQIVVATPGRLLDHVQRRSIRLEHVTCIVLDEADEMLDMGFYKDVTKILDSLKNRRQMGMFSATMSRPVMDISWLYQRDPVEIVVEPVKASAPNITQYALLTTGWQKLADVADIITQHDYDRVMIFCNTKYHTEMLARQLIERRGLDAECLHGDLAQRERNKIMADFKEGRLRILVSTDVSARGIDVDDVDAVINYDVPTSNEYYTHRIGRTGRAKKTGEAYLLFLEEERRCMEEMLRLTGNTATFAHFDQQRNWVIEK